VFWSILAIALAGIAVERLWPANQLPRVDSWWGRVLLTNLLQLSIVTLTGLGWHQWLAPHSLFHLSTRNHALSNGMTAYLVSTFVYYWWHRYRHQSQFFWRLCHQLHHSARRIEILTSFYKHPVEILLNALLSSCLIYWLLGCTPQAGACCALFAAIAEFFYHWNVRTPRWLGYFVQRPESHRVHHQFQRHTNNFADLPIWDALFGTLQNAVVSPPRCGFEAGREKRFEEMLAFRDVHGKRRPSRTLLPICIGCRKRSACMASGSKIAR
jgi:sterol desaturase/sphingolipid hydroxylase (fatty acid hydroxylase superfamily)